MKGGVGKTTLAVNLASIAARSGRRTLLWDLDGQAAATYIVADKRKAHDEARAVLERDIAPEDIIRRTRIPNLDLLPADSSLRALDALFAELDKKNRLARLIEKVARDYDRVILDCPPGLGHTSEQVMRGASLILLPMIPSTLSRRALDEVRGHLDQRHKGGPPVMPVFTMVDRRRNSHRDAAAANPDYPLIPMASAVEQMADRHAAVAEYAPSSPAAKAFADLWITIERAIADKG